MEARVVQVLTSVPRTPHSTVNAWPREALNNRKLEITLPEPTFIRFKHQNFMSQHASANIAKKDAMQKQKTKICVDHKVNAQDRNITAGDIILLRQPKQNKGSTPYSPKPFAVEKKKVSMVTVCNESQNATRNSSQFKVVPKHLVQSQDLGGRSDVSETLKTVENTPVVHVQANPAEPKENPPLRWQIKPPVRFADCVHVVYTK